MKPISYVLYLFGAMAAIAFWGMRTHIYATKPTQSEYVIIIAVFFSFSCFAVACALITKKKVGEGGEGLGNGCYICKMLMFKSALRVLHDKHINEMATRNNDVCLSSLIDMFINVPLHFGE